MSFPNNNGDFLYSYGNIYQRITHMWMKRLEGTNYVFAIKSAGLEIDGNTFKTIQDWQDCLKNDVFSLFPNYCS